MKKIYIVFGESGEYEDYSDWMVRAFSSEEKANILRDRLNQLARQCGVYRQHVYRQHELNLTWGMRETAEEIFRTPGNDPRCRIDYTGVNYIVADLDLEE